MKVSIELPTPEQVTIGQFVSFFKAKSDVNKCIAATGMSRDEVSALPLSVVMTANNSFTQICSEIKELEFPRIIEIESISFGFEPNLNRLSTAAWADISHLEDLGRDEHLHEILAILYRPITARIGTSRARYRIEDYALNKGDSIDNADLFLSYKVCHARSVLAFFLTLHEGYMSDLAAQITTELATSVKEMKKEITTI